MKRLIITFLSLLIFLLLSVTGVLLFLFSQKGNDLLKPYIQERIEREIGIPVEVNTFVLRSGSTKMDLTLNHALRIKTISRYNLWQRSFVGGYRIVAHNFEYKGSRLRQADIRGRFKGVPADIFVEGNGTALDSPLWYRLRLADDSVKQLEAQMRGVSLSELLALAKQPPLAKGRVDLQIDMPHIGKEGAKGTARLQLHDAILDRSLIQRRYGVALPKKSRVEMKADARLEGRAIRFGANARSELFSAEIKEGYADIEAKSVTADYRFETKALQVLTGGKLAGALKLDGDLKAADGGYLVRGSSHSLGGTLHFESGAHTKVMMQGVELGKLLAMLRAPHYVTGSVEGRVDIPQHDFATGSYHIRVPDGVLSSSEMAKLGYTVPKGTTFVLKSEGKIADKVLHAETTATSKIADIGLHHTRYEITSGKLTTDYLVKLYDLEALLGKKPSRKAGRAQHLTADGTLTYNGTLALSGGVEGLGKRMTYTYDGRRAKLDAVSLHVDKLLALVNLPHYLRGSADLSLNVTDLKRGNGTFALHGKGLQSDPNAMQKLIGKPLKMQLSADVTGRLKAHKAYGKATLDTSLGSVELPNFVATPKAGTFATPFRLEIPDLTKLYTVTGTKLYGSLLTSGRITKGKVLTVDGTTASLGGKTVYALRGERATLTVEAVPLPNLMHLTGYPQNFLGNVSGKAQYNLASRKGSADFSIDAFQIKPNRLTALLASATGKDPSRIIFKSTTFHADINKEIVTYTLHAKGSYSSIDITDAHINQQSRSHSAKLKFVYGKDTVYGKIKGTIDDPKIRLDLQEVVKEKLKEKIRDRVQDKLQKALGDKAGALLRGFGL